MCNPIKERSDPFIFSPSEKYLDHLVFFRLTQLAVEPERASIDRREHATASTQRPEEQGSVQWPSPSVRQAVNVKAHLGSKRSSVK